MHKQRFNALKIECKLQPEESLLVKSGTFSLNPSLPDMQFVRTQTPEGEKVFIPGSSLKGVFRSFSEKVLRTVNGQWACNPFEKDSEDKACGQKLKEEESSSKVYRESCYVCKIYGNTRLRGRLSFTDFMPQEEVVTEIRYGVAISRLTNAVISGPFDMEVLVGGTFVGYLVLENFEVWQLGLVGLTLKAIEEKLVRVGFGKNRGFGEVKIRPTSISVEMVRHHELSSREIWGVGRFVDSESLKAYGLRQDDKIGELPEAERKEESGFYVRREYGEKDCSTLVEKAVERLRDLQGGKP